MRLLTPGSSSALSSATASLATISFAVPFGEDAGPDAHLIIDARLTCGRHIGQCRQALGAGHCIGLDGAGGNLRGHAHRLLAEEIDMAADEIVHAGPVPR